MSHVHKTILAPHQMLVLLGIAFCLVAATVSVHAVGLALLLKSVLRSETTTEVRFWAVTWLVVRMAWWLIMIHLLEIAIWATFYWWQGCLQDAESSFYFAGVTYTTLGYGDLVLPLRWRMLGPIEGLTGILMCGLSTGLFFAVMSRAFAPKTKMVAPKRTPDL